MFYINIAIALCSSIALLLHSISSSQPPQIEQNTTITQSIPPIPQTTNNQQIAQPKVITKPKEAPKKSYYKELAEYAKTSVDFTFKDHETNALVVKPLSGEKMYENFLNEYKNANLSNEDLDKLFKNYVGSFYKKILGEKHFDEYQKNTKIDILDYKNYIPYSTLQEALYAFDTKDNK